ncbi:hypothetical protein ACVNRM_07765 [Bacillus paranthracis]|uniref:hypothetical protein n=1 Tax=Bacillus TaxID=1386 RepID=UPI0002793113|nr:MULTISPECIES: hypothetical protein [Bacillus]EJQ04077.1 hypothetical protein IC5_02617 [Bacillus cereus AND1407]KFL83864.1 hypothetical protein DJ51_3071 [Bacillus cereus]MRA59295.1 hypothetical protein [Bacillus thuringiensis]OUB98402.1 hypothetical protein BK752_12660 [Bacillus thuringiensis serovar canadensis]KAB7640182.1 hypothetical protein GBN96_07265 [Bacillus sp. B4-WWTP-NA-D-NA-NA]
MFNKKAFKKLFLLGAMSLLTLSACSAKEKADYEPYKKHESVENAQREEGTSNSDKGEKIDEEPAKDEELQQVEETTKGDKEINDRRPYYKDANNDAPTVSLEQYEGIKVGMSANKVKEIAGAPRFIEKYKSFSIYGYLGHGGEGTMTITFNPDGSVTKKEQDGLRNTRIQDATANGGNEGRVTSNHERDSKPATKSNAKIPNDYCGHGHDETKELAHGCDKIIDREAHRRHIEQQEREYEEQQRKEMEQYELSEEDKMRIKRQEKRWNTPSGGIGGTWQDEMKEMESQE